MGSSFSFSLDTKEKTTTTTVVVKKKKISPSTKRRNARKRQEFLAAKETLSSVNVEGEIEPQLVPTVEDNTSTIKKVTCDQCSHRTKTEAGMKLHKRKKHEIAQVDANDTMEDSHHELTAAKEVKETQTDPEPDESTKQIKDNHLHMNKLKELLTMSFQVIETLEDHLNKASDGKYKRSELFQSLVSLKSRIIDELKHKVNSV